MCQLVKVPTRSKALLELLITTNPERIADVEVGDNLGNSNHGSLMFTVKQTR